MKEELKLVALHHSAGAGYDLSFLNLETAKTVRKFHQSFPMYQPTPLAHLTETAKALGLACRFCGAEMGFME